MENFMETQETIKNWMSRVGLSTVALREQEQRCSFKINDALVVSVEWPTHCDDVFIVIQLMSTQGGDVRRQMLEEGMKLNAFVLSTRGAALGWDEVNDQLLLSYRLDRMTLDEFRLGQTINNMVEVAQDMIEQLAAVQADSATPKFQAGDARASLRIEP